MCEQKSTLEWSWEGESNLWSSWIQNFGKYLRDASQGFISIYDIQVGKYEFRINEPREYLYLRD